MKNVKSIETVKNQAARRGGQAWTYWPRYVTAKRLARVCDWKRTQREPIGATRKEAPRVAPEKSVFAKSREIGEDRSKVGF
jgi:hypothetical protein